VDTFTVRCNKEERAMLEELKEIFDISSDSTALKTAAEVGRNVLLHHFGRPLLRYLFKKERARLSDCKSF
jgi:hypothetical protein